jgi:hypothetical protein
MKSSLQRKVPSDREERKTSHGFQCGQGKRVDILVGLRRATATVISPTRNGNGVVVRLRQQHNRQLNREESQELSRLLTELKRYEKDRWNDLAPGAYAECERLRGRIAKLTNVKPVKITRTFAIAPEQIKIRQTAEPKRQQVSDTEKRKLRKKQLLNAIQLKLIAGVNPKRLKRMLKRTQFANIKVGKLHTAMNPIDVARQRRYRSLKLANEA